MNSTLRPTYANPPIHWARSKDGVIAGVCGGLAKRLEIEAWMVRFFWVMSIFFLGTGLIAYFVLTICLPREDRTENAYDKMFLGVCVRLARRAQVEIGLVRTAVAFFALSTFGAVFFAYIALYFLMPDPAPEATP